MISVHMNISTDISMNIHIHDKPGNSPPNQQWNRLRAAARSAGGAIIVPTHESVDSSDFIKTAAGE